MSHEQHPPPQKLPRVTDLSRMVSHRGSKRTRLNDVYHAILRMKWRHFIGSVVAFFLAVNLLFAALLSLEDGDVNNATTFADLFFFSVQSWATIGYGGMTPATTFANLIVTVEAIASTLFTAIVTGLVFVKFARPTSRVLFAKTALVTTFDGKRVFMFRCANERGNAVMEATARVTMILPTLTKEGERFRKLVELPLVRNVSPLFIISWTVVHEIDERSPLFGLTHQDLVDGDVRISVTLMGYDGDLGQTVHASYAYWPEHVAYDHRYVDVTTTLADGSVELDHTRFHDTAPLAP